MCHEHKWPLSLQQKTKLYRDTQGTEWTFDTAACVLRVCEGFWPKAKQKWDKTRRAQKEMIIMAFTFILSRRKWVSHVQNITHTRKHPLSAGHSAENSKNCSKEWDEHPKALQTMFLSASDVVSPNTHKLILLATNTSLRTKCISWYEHAASQCPQYSGSRPIRHQTQMGWIREVFRFPYRTLSSAHSVLSVCRRWESISVDGSWHSPAHSSRPFGRK